MKNKVLAISAIGAGLIAICLLVACYFNMATLIALALTSVFVTLPVYYKSFKSALLCYGAGGILAFLLSGFNFLNVIFPAYLLFFGLYPIYFFYCKLKGLNNFIVHIIGIIWCIICVIGLYYFFINVLGGVLVFKFEFINNYILIFLIISSFVFYFFFIAYINCFMRFTERILQKVFKNND